MPLAFVSLTIAALAGTRPHEAGLASGLINTSQQIGGAVGIAILSTVATSTTSDAVASGTAVPAALTEGFQNAFWVGAAITLVGVIVSLLLVRQRDFVQAPALEPAPEAVEAARREQSGRLPRMGRCGSSSSASSPASFSSLFGVGGGIVIVPLLIARCRLRRDGGDRHVARRDRDHGARRSDAVRPARQGRRRLRGARRDPGDGRSDDRRGSPAAALGASLTVAFAVFLAAVGVWLLVG